MMTKINKRRETIRNVAEQKAKEVVDKMGGFLASKDLESLMPSLYPLRELLNDVNYHDVVCYVIQYLVTLEYTIEIHTTEFTIDLQQTKKKEKKA